MTTPRAIALAVTSVSPLARQASGDRDAGTPVVISPQDRATSPFAHPARHRVHFEAALRVRNRNAADGLRDGTCRRSQTGWVPFSGYDPCMRFLPNILAVLSLPAGVLGYTVATRVLTALLPGQAQGILMLFVPLLVAGLFMLPFLVPFFDRKAKQDLAEYRSREGLTKNSNDKPGTHEGGPRS
jgi:hypothetical protein